MPFSVNKLSAVTGYSRAAIQRRVDLHGPDPKKILYLSPLSEEHVNKISLEEARTELAIEDTLLKRASREKLEGKLSRMEELLTTLNNLNNLRQTA